MISFFTKKTNAAAIAGLILVAARYFGWSGVDEEAINSLVDAVFFLGLMFLRRGVQKAEQAARAGA